MSSHPHPPLLEETSESELPVSQSEKAEALRFALESESLGRSDRLKAMLRFICETEFAGRHEQLTEYEIAVSALGRRKDFSPIDDSTVRSRAFELRQKLERLYSVEAPTYPVRISVPKGSYRPRFLRHRAAISDHPVGQISTIPSSDTHSARIWPKWMIPAIAFICGIIITLGVLLADGHLISTLRRSSQTGWSPELRTFWAPFLSNSRPTILVYESRLFFQVGPLIVRDPEIEIFKDAPSSTGLMQVEHALNVQQLMEARRYSDYSMVNAAFSLGQLLGGAQVPLRAVRSDELTNDDIAHSNLIMMGKPGAYDNLTQIPPGARNFVYERYHDSQYQSVRNLHPLPGELPLYEYEGGTVESGGTTEEYGLITLSPGPFKGQHVLTIVSGESALFRPLALYITDPNYVRDLVSHLREPSGNLPDAFEILVKIEMRGYQPQRITYVAHRMLPVKP